MKTDDFFFDLPERLIAQHPPEHRGEGRLMTLDRVTGERTHESVAQLPGILCGGRFLGPRGEKPLLVFNDTRVRKARITGRHEQTGAETEFLLLEDIKGDCVVWKVMKKRARRKKEGSVYVFFDNEGARIAKASATGFEGEYPLLEFDRPIDDRWLEKHGHVPLPPYIKRKDAPADAERYQTIYAKHTGSAAAPTAGLHFTRELMDALCACGIESAFVTLHVGLGTFLPVRSENVEDHVMHEEIFDIDENSAVKIEKAKEQGRKIIAVGTTSVRTLESAFAQGAIKRGRHSTSIFIYPPYRFKAADALFTNFHTPRSTLLMLVSAFAGRELSLESYAEAVREGYRFFSYGDAMLIY
jgi:S-adenosylmethionine:tRNA ribosyltransferase-isomerase